VGDAVMATPALRALRAAHPDATIVVEGRPALEPLLHGLPFFDEFLPDPPFRGLRGALTRAATLRRRELDLALLLPDSVRAALGPFLGGIPHRIGYARDPLRRALLNDRVDTPHDADGKRLPIPMVERYLRLTRHLGCPDLGEHEELRVDDSEAARIEAELAALGIETGEPLLTVSPGAGFGPSKLWPARSFAEACGELARRFGLRPVLAPAPNEVEIAASIAALDSNIATWRADASATLGGLKALLARSQLVLTNDTGPRHIAVALAVPVITVMGPTDPRHTHCNLELQRVLREDVSCSPCQKKVCPIDHRCMTRLAPERVVEAAVELMSLRVDEDQ
jgi:heptosyltransferase-2